MNKQNRTEIKQQVQTELYAGAVPPPALLKQFNEVDPTFAERIFKMAEAQNEHMISRDREIKCVLDSDILSVLNGIDCFQSFSGIFKDLFKSCFFFFHLF